MKVIPFSVPQIDTNYLKILIKCLLSNAVYRGRMLDKFERKFALFIGVKYAISFASARYCLYLLYKFFNCENKKVIFPAYTCIPALDALRWAGGIPCFVDIDAGCYNPSFPNEFNTWENIGAITLSYLYGLVGDIDPFLELAKAKKIPVIEDAAIALGAEYNGKKIGSLADAGVFSLQSSKIITAWKGGVITTNNKALFDFLYKERESLKRVSFPKLCFNLLLTYLRGHLANYNLYGNFVYPLKKIALRRPIAYGIRGLINQNPIEAISGESQSLLPEYEKVRFTNLQASIALASLNNIETILRKRRGYARAFNLRLAKNPHVRISEENGRILHSYGRYPIRITGCSKFDLQKYFSQAGIEVAIYYPYTCVEAYPCDTIDLPHYPNAHTASVETVLLPFHTRLKEKDIEYITEEILKIVNLKKQI